MLITAINKYNKTIILEYDSVKQAISNNYQAYENKTLTNFKQLR